MAYMEDIQDIAAKRVGKQALGIPRSKWKTVIKRDRE
jgi:hypothetical protein